MKGFMLRKLAIVTLSLVSLVPLVEAKKEAKVDKTIKHDQTVLAETQKQLQAVRDEFNPKEVNKVFITITKHDDKIISTEKRTYLGNKYRGGSEYSSQVYNADEKPTEIVEIKYNINERDELRVAYKDPVSKKTISKEEVQLTEEINLNKDINLSVAA